VGDFGVDLVVGLLWFYMGWFCCKWCQRWRIHRRLDQAERRLNRQEK